MFKISFLMMIITFLVSLGVPTEAKAINLNCRFTNSQTMEIQSVKVKDDLLVINNEIEIPLEKNRVRCGNFREQIRLDGLAYGYQIILKSCTTEAEFEGDLIDTINWVGSSLLCD